MSSPVSICNLSLSRLKAPKISNIDEASLPAQYCKTFYDSDRKSTLRAFPWGFACKDVVLGFIGQNLFKNWQYIYAYPTDCLKLRSLFNDYTAGNDPDVPTNPWYRQPGVVYRNIAPYIPQYKVYYYQATGNKVICTNLEKASLNYTSNIENPELFDDLFIEAFSYKLASDLAVPLLASEGMREQMLKMFQQCVNRAGEEDADESYIRPQYGNDYIAARL